MVRAHSGGFFVRIRLRRGGSEGLSFSLPPGFPPADVLAAVTVKVMDTAVPAAGPSF